MVYAIPQAVLVGFGREQAVQYICPCCGDRFFPVARLEDRCSRCVKQPGVKAKNRVFSEAFFVSIVGWDQRFAASRKRTSYNFKKAMIRDEYTCQYCAYSPTYCKQFVPLHVDHIIPFSAGGGNALSNLVVACQWCNLKVTNKIFDDFYDKKAFIVEDRKSKSLPVNANQWREYEREI